MSTTAAIYSWRSQNGRWGVDLVGDPQMWEANRTAAGWYGRGEVVRGAVLPLGEASGVTVFRYVPPQENPATENLFVVLDQDLEEVEGCRLMTNMGLQGNASQSILVAREGAIWKDYSYRRRGVKYKSLVAGEVQDVPVGVLVAAGIVQARGGGEQTLPEVPSISPALRRAWEEAGDKRQ